MAADSSAAEPSTDKKMMATCCNCRKTYEVDEVTVKRWREDGTVGQCTCRPCGCVAAAAVREECSLKLLSGEARAEFFQRAAGMGGKDVRKVFDETLTVTQTKEYSSESMEEGSYELVADLAQRSPYRSNRDALDTLVKNSYTITGLDGLERVYVPKYGRKEFSRTGSRAQKETTISARTQVAKAKAVGKAKAKPKAKAVSIQDDHLKTYPKKTQNDVKKNVTILEKTAMDIQEKIFVLGDASAQDYTSIVSIRNGNASIKSCLEYAKGIKKGIADKVTNDALSKLVKDCQESLKEAKKIQKKLTGSQFVISHFKLRASISRFRVPDFEFLSSNFGLRVSDFEFRTSGFGVRVRAAAFDLQTSGFKRRAPRGHWLLRHSPSHICSCDF
jgi:hypothetical protein